MHSSSRLGLVAIALSIASACTPRAREEAAASPTPQTPNEGSTRRTDLPYPQFRDVLGDDLDPRFVANRGLRVRRDPHGRWAVACVTPEPEPTEYLWEGRSLPALNLTLFSRGSRDSGTRLDGFYGSDPTGRHVVIGKDESIILRDMEKQVDTDLSAWGIEPWRLLSDGWHQRFIRFSGDGRLALIFANGTSGASKPGRALLLDLSTRKKRWVDTAGRVIWSGGLSDDGQWAYLDLEPGPASWENPLPHDGRYEPPFCNALDMNAWGDWSPENGVVNFDETERVFVRTRDDSLEMVEGALIPFGDGLLVRHSDGSIVIRGARGEEQELVPSDCDGEIVSVHPDYGAVVMACSGQLVVYGTGGRKVDTAIRAFSDTVRPALPSSGRFTALLGWGSATHHHLFDLKRWKIVWLPSDLKACRWRGDEIYVRGRNGRVGTWRLDPDTGKPRPVSEDHCYQGLEAHNLPD